MSGEDMSARHRSILEADLLAINVRRRREAVMYLVRSLALLLGLAVLLVVLGVGVVMCRYWLARVPVTLVFNPSDDRAEP